LKMSSSESPACASSSCGKYILPLVALKDMMATVEMVTAVLF
jgi:hypothetical protein